MLRSLCLRSGLLAALAASGCAFAVHRTDGSPAASATAEAAGPADEAARELETARQKLEIARLETEQQMLQARQAVTDAEHELAKAQEELAHFLAEAMPRQVRSAELGLTGARDGVRETEEEMAQLEMMYGQDELADATAEIVLARTRRRLELGRARLVLEEQEFAALRDFRLPWDRKDKELALRRAQVGLDAAQMSLRKLELERRLAEQEAAKELQELETKRGGRKGETQ